MGEHRLAAAGRVVVAVLLASVAGCGDPPASPPPGAEASPADAVPASRPARPGPAGDDGDAAEAGAASPTDRDPRPEPSSSRETEPGAEASPAFVALLEENGIRYLPANRRLEVSGWVDVQRGLIEVFACAPEGKTHEAVVVLDCIPSGLHAGLLALGLEPGTAVESGTDAEYEAPTGDSVIVEVRWRGPDGDEHAVRAEDWIWNEADQHSMPHVEWLFTGSILQSVTGDPQDVTYGANYVKSLVTTYHDATTVIENPLFGGADDTLYYANEHAVPAVGTPVTVIFRPGQPAKPAGS